MLMPEDRRRRAGRVFAGEAFASTSASVAGAATGAAGVIVGPIVYAFIKAGFELSKEDSSSDYLQDKEVMPPPRMTTLVPSLSETFINVGQETKWYPAVQSTQIDLSHCPSELQQEDSITRWDQFPTWGDLTGWGDLPAYGPRQNRPVANPMIYGKAVPVYVKNKQQR